MRQPPKGKQTCKKRFNQMNIFDMLVNMTVLIRLLASFKSWAITMVTQQCITGSKSVIVCDMSKCCPRSSQGVLCLREQYWRLEQRTVWIAVTCCSQWRHISLLWWRTILAASLEIAMWASQSTKSMEATECVGTQTAHFKDCLLSLQQHYISTISLTIHLMCMQVTCLLSPENTTSINQFVNMEMGIFYLITRDSWYRTKITYSNGIYKNCWKLFFLAFAAF